MAAGEFGIPSPHCRAELAVHSPNSPPWPPANWECPARTARPGSSGGIRTVSGLANSRLGISALPIRDECATVNLSGEVSGEYLIGGGRLIQPALQKVQLFCYRRGAHGTPEGLTVLPAETVQKNHAEHVDHATSTPRRSEARAELLCARSGNVLPAREMAMAPGVKVLGSPAQPKKDFLRQFATLKKMAKGEG
jgi:hypothetical protein